MRFQLLAKWLIFFLLMVGDADHAQAQAERRVALVIGNSAYEYATRLRNPGNDSDAMAAALGTLGFEVFSGRDLSRSQTERLLRDFGRNAAGADLALVFFAGHGLQVDGENWILPVDAKLEEALDLPFEALPLDTLMRSLDGASARVLMLDACRDNPFVGRMQSTGMQRSLGRGLAPIEVRDRGTLVVFATAPGMTADDGSGANSPFTTALLEHLATPGMEIRQLLTRVRQSVVTSTGGRQTPWENSSLLSDIYLSVRQPPVEANQPPAATRLPSDHAADLAWGVIAPLPDGPAKHRALESFLADFGQSPYAGAARALLAALGDDPVMPTSDPIRPVEPQEVQEVEVPTDLQVAVGIEEPSPSMRQELSDADTLSLRHHWQPGAIGGLSFSGDGRYLQWVAETGMLYRASVGTGHEERLLSLEPKPAVIAASADGLRYVFSEGGQSGAAASHRLHVQDLTAGAPSTQLNVEGADVGVITLNKNGTLLAWGPKILHPSGVEILVWNTDEKRASREFSIVGRDMLDSQRIGRWHDYEYLQQESLGRTLAGATLDAIHFSSNSDLVITAENRLGVGIVRLWQVQSLPDHQIIQYEPGRFFSNDAPRRERWELARFYNEQRIHGVALSLDSNSLAAASEDRTVRVWQLEAGRQRLRLDHAAAATAVRFAPDGRSLASGSADGRTYLWSSSGGRKLAQSDQLTKSSGAEVLDLRFSPDGRMLAAATRQGVALWNIGLVD